MSKEPVREREISVDCQSFLYLPGEKSVFPRKKSKKPPQYPGKQGIEIHYQKGDGNSC